MWETRAAMGTDAMPAEPISGLILTFMNRFMIFAVITPDAVPNKRASRPSTTIKIVSQVRNLSAAMVEPMATVRVMMMMFISAPPAVLANRSVTPTSFSRLPSISMVISGATGGKNRLTMMAITAGKTIFSSLLTLRICAISILRSTGLVSSLITGGWIMGISAM